ncbi:hypothetical protein [Salinisphaera sp.]|uniref:hypothetical protein n=1 Tax=Salinisphaera sp. TaxID=1914330 RepID=UPI002D76DDA6|nr:hypothetical protein [Salinisphaera sp.]HET7313037.1 hypothetical protein [Salinisphaera sp.]
MTSATATPAVLNSRHRRTGAGFTARLFLALPFALASLPAWAGPLFWILNPAGPVARYSRRAT